MEKATFNVESHKKELQSYFNGVGFERWSAIYGQSDVSMVRRTIRDGHAIMMDQARTWLTEHKLPQDARILDAGCGTGLFSLSIAKLGFRTMSIDIAPQMVEKARQEAIKLGVVDRMEFKASDLEQVTGSYDAVVCFDVLIHYPAHGFKPMCTKLANMSKGPFIFTYAPYNRLLAFQHWVGGHFPKNERRTEIQMLKDSVVKETLEAAGMRINRTKRISHAFYHAALVEAVPIR
jgi:magnesium-protoporphyrin O-methyltransferase